MGNNLWMTSEGLDIDLSATEKKKIVPTVKINSLVGNLVSLESNPLRVSFRCTNIQEALEYIDEKITSFVVEYETFNLTQAINAYNYKVTITGSTALVTLEEKNSHEE